MGGVGEPLKLYASSTTLHGPSHVLDAPFGGLKVFWIVLFTISAIYCSYQAFFLIKDYRAESILTSVSTIDKLNKSQYATLLYCPNDWISEGKIEEYQNASQLNLNMTGKDYVDLLAGLGDRKWEDNSEILDNLLTLTGCINLDCAFVKLSKDLDFPTLKSTKVMAMDGVCHSYQASVSAGNTATLAFLHTDISADVFPSYSITFNKYNLVHPKTPIKKSHVNVPEESRMKYLTLDLTAKSKKLERKMALEILKKRIQILAVIQTIKSELSHTCWFKLLQLELEDSLTALYFAFEDEGFAGILSNIQSDQHEDKAIEALIYLTDMLPEADHISEIINNWVTHEHNGNVPCHPVATGGVYWEKKGQIEETSKCCPSINLSSFTTGKYDIFDSELPEIDVDFYKMTANTVDAWLDIFIYVYKELLLGYNKFPQGLVMRGVDPDVFTLEIHEHRRINVIPSDCKEYPDLLSTAIHNELCVQNETTQQQRRQLWMRYNHTWGNLDLIRDAPLVQNLSYCPNPVKSCRKISFELKQLETELKRSDIDLNELLEDVDETIWKTISPIPLVGYTGRDLVNGGQIFQEMELTGRVSHEYLNKSLFQLEMNLYQIYKTSEKAKKHNFCHEEKPCWFIRHITIEFLYAVRYAERLQYSTLSLLGNVGGLFGLFIGASIMSIVHLLMFCLTSLPCFKRKSINVNAEDKYEEPPATIPVVHEKF